METVKSTKEKQERKGHEKYNNGDNKEIDRKRNNNTVGYTEYRGRKTENQKEKIKNYRNKKRRNRGNIKRVKGMD